MLLHFSYEMTPSNPCEKYNIEDLNSDDDKNIITCQYAFIFQLWDDPSS